MDVKTRGMIIYMNNYAKRFDTEQHQFSIIMDNDVKVPTLKITNVESKQHISINLFKEIYVSLSDLDQVDGVKISSSILSLMKKFEVKIRYKR